MKKYLSFLFVLFLLYACKDNPSSPAKPVNDINQLVKDAGDLTPQPQTFSKNVINTKTESTQEGDVPYISQSSQIRMTNKFDEIVAFNSYADVLYPGAIIQGKDILDGKLTSIGDFPREPMTITLQGGNSLKIENPSLSTITKGITDILKTATPTPAQMTYSKSEMYSTEQSFLELGLDANWLVAQISGKFQKETSVTKKSILIYFKQIYYTISTNSFSNPSDYFASSVNVDQLKQKIYSGNPPCYISTVNYGRIIIAKMTSTESYSKMKTTLEGSYGVVNGKACFDKSKFNINSTFDAIIVGGSAQDAAEAVTNGTIDKINELIQSDAVFSSTNLGLPISYTVRYLNGGSPLKLGKTTDYWQQDWQLDNSQLQKFDLYFSHFGIVDDGNTWSKGNFYYTISVKDTNGNILKDVNGNDAVIETDRYSAIETGSGENLMLSKQIFGVSLKKNNGEQFSVNVDLWDKFSSGNDEKAGTGGLIYHYPWNSADLPVDWYTLNLSGSGYVTNLVYRIEKK